MQSSLELIQRRERLRVGQRFLRARPVIALVAALGNGALLATSAAPAHQKAVVGGAFGLTIAAFFAESAWLAKHPLGERWLFASLALTLLALAGGAAASGGIQSPILPLLFAPVVVGFAAFTRDPRPIALLTMTALLLGGLTWALPNARFPTLPTATVARMLLVSALASFALLFVGVSGLVEAHSATSRELDRLRSDLLAEAERRATSVENLGAQAAHEVKNPLAAARGLVELVQRRTEDPRDRHRLDVVLAEIDRALAVLQDYLSLARPLTDLSLSSLSTASLLEDVCLLLEARAAQKSARMVVAGEDVQVWGDRLRLRDAVLNLALNAIAALPRGGALTLSTVRRGERVEIVVSDDGPGMDPSLLARLGRPFTSESPGGTGLGVLMAQSVARQHGGELRIQSAPGRGTSASLALPLAEGGH